MASSQQTARREGAPPSVHLTLVAVQLIFGGFHVIGKAVLSELTPLAVAGIRVGVAAPLMLLVAWRHDRCLPSVRDLPHLALLGFLGVFANQLLFIVGLSYTTATNAAILMPSIPVFAVALGALFGIERVSRRRAFGIASAVAGALVLLDPTRFSLASETLLGNLLVLTNCLSYAAFLVAQRPLLERLPWRTVIAWAFLLGGSGVMAVSGRWLAALEPATVPGITWLGVAYVALFPTVLGYLWATWAVRRSSPALVAAYTTLQPLASTLLAALFLGERAGWRSAVGFALIVTGLWGVSGPAGRRRGSPAQEEPSPSSSRAARTSDGDGRLR